jgi:hypothetical protein
MIATNCDKRMPECDFHQSRRQIINQTEQGVTADNRAIKRGGTCADRTLRLVVDILVGVFCLWVSLTILGVIGLNNIGQEVIPSVSLKIVAASGLALMVSIIIYPLLVPWLVVFVLAHLLIPRTSFLWKWWLCTVVGSFVGIVALWIDALVCTLLGSEPSISLNVPLLTAASIPAAVLGGSICFAAAMTENAASRRKGRAVR